MINSDIKDIVIHATNVAGLGAREVSSSIVNSLAKHKNCKDYKIQLRVPSIKFWRDNSPKMDNWEIVYFYRSTIPLIRFFIRVFNLFFGHLFLPKSDLVLVLGDFPLRIKSNQLVLLHNPHLVPENTYVKKFDKFLFQRFFFKLNHKFINTCIVQTEIIQNRLINKFPNLADKVIVLPMPVNNLYKYEKGKNLNKRGEFKLLIFKLYEKGNFNFKLDFILTIDEHQFNSLGTALTYNNVSIHFTGQLDKYQVLEMYSYSNALFFPSFDESYGLPLVEAMKIGKIIICSDKPFSRWLCGDEAIYFDPNDFNSAEKAIKFAYEKWLSGWKPNWAIPLSKIPENWDSYFFEFQKYL